MTKEKLLKKASKCKTFKELGMALDGTTKQNAYIKAKSLGVLKEIRKILDNNKPHLFDYDSKKIKNDTAGIIKLTMDDGVYFCATKNGIGVAQALVCNTRKKHMKNPKFVNALKKQKGKIKVELVFDGSVGKDLISIKRIIISDAVKKGLNVLNQYFTRTEDELKDLHRKKTTELNHKYPLKNLKKLGCRRIYWTRNGYYKICSLVDGAYIRYAKVLALAKQIQEEEKNGRS